uniref:Transmembrane protein n=1 Tax=Strongyloides papillosus TaxID=174720 RepID=A0A0N5CHQ2_STREA
MLYTTYLTLLLIISTLFKLGLSFQNAKNSYQICSKKNPIDSIQIPIPLDCSSLEFEKIYFTKTTIIKILPNGGCQSYVMPVYFNKKFIYIQGLSNPFFKRIYFFPRSENSCVPKNSEPIGGDYFIKDPDQFFYATQYECSACYHYFIKNACELSNEFAYDVLKIKRETTSNDETGIKIARLLTRRNDVTGIVSGLSVQIMECNLYKPDEVYFNKSIGDICYEEIPVRIGKTIYFTRNNLDLLITGTKVNCYSLFNIPILIFMLVLFIFLIISIPPTYYIAGFIGNSIIFFQINILRHIYNFEIKCWFTLVWYELNIQSILNLEKGWCGLGSFLSLICCKKIENLKTYEAEYLTNIAINKILQDRKDELNLALEEGMLARSKEFFGATNFTHISDKSIIYDL